MIEKPFMIKDIGELLISTAIGASKISSEHSSLDDMLNYADKNMYSQKA